MGLTESVITVYPGKYGISVNLNVTITDASNVGSQDDYDADNIKTNESLTWLPLVYSFRIRLLGLR